MTDNIQGKQIKVGNLDIHYFTAGHGEPPVVIHGAGGGTKSWLQSGTGVFGHYRVGYMFPTCPDLVTASR